MQDHEKVISELDMKVKSTEKTVASLRAQLTEVQDQRENFKVCCTLQALLGPRSPCGVLTLWTANGLWSLSAAA